MTCRYAGFMAIAMKLAISLKYVPGDKVLTGSPVVFIGSSGFSMVLVGS